MKPNTATPAPINWKRNTAIFLLSQGVSLFGSALVQYAITWYITLSTGSGAYMTLSIVFGILPTFFLSPFAGVWADRYNRKLLIILADGGIALCTLGVAVLFLLGYESIWLLFGALAFRALGAAVQTPCVGAMLPDMVPEEHLTRVNGINSSMLSLLNLLAPILSASLMTFLPIGRIFFIDVFTAVIGIGIMLFFFQLPASRKQKTPETETARNYFHDMKLGFQYIFKHPYLRNFFAFCILFFFMMAPVAFLTPLQIVRVWGEEVWRLSALEVSFAVGMLAGGLLVSVWGGLKNRVHTIAAAAFGMGACTIALSFPFNFWIYLGFMAIFGILMPFLNTAAMVLLQERVDPDYIGRIFGVMTMINTSMMPAGMLLFGPLADAVQIEWLLLPTGAVMLAGALVMNRNKPLLLAGAPKPKLPAEKQDTSNTNQ